MNGGFFGMRNIGFFMLLVCTAGCMLAAGCTRVVEPKGVIYRPDFETVAEEVPVETREYTVDEYEQMGDAAFRRGDLEFAFFNYKKALKHEPESLNLRCKRAWVLLAGDFNKEAAREFKAVLEKNEQSASAREGLGQARFRMKDYDQAREQFEKALAIDPGRWRAHNFLGIMYNHENEPGRAIDEFTAALAVKPDSGILYNNLGMAYSSAGRYEEALAAYRRAYELGAPRVKTLNNIGIVLATMGRVGEAREVFVEAGGEALAYNNLGCVYLFQGDYENAEKSFKKAVSISPEDTAAEKNLEKCRREMN